jgi:glycolate oxidase FAD binding subunit
MGSGPAGALPIDLPAGIVELSPEDLVVTVGTGTRLCDLAEELGQRNLRLGLGPTPFTHPETTLAESIALALPHLEEARFGTWRDWILGCTVVLGDGTVARSGSRAVKSVAGYDVHKLPVGARGVFGIVIEVHLRLFAGRAHLEEGVAHPTGQPWIARVDLSEVDRVADQCTPLVTDPSTGTLWGEGAPPLLPVPSWLIQPGPLALPPGELIFFQRAKRLLDPESKLNPGAVLGL